jgi:xanthine dehydrogenase accessory factor
MMDLSKLVCICGGNEIATAAALKLFESGHQVLMLVHPDENLLRYHLCLGDALYQGQKTVENVTAMLLPEDKLNDNPEDSYSEKFLETLIFLFKDRKIPVVRFDEMDMVLGQLKPQIIINTYSSKNSTVTIDLAPLVIGLYPLHQPGIQCHFAVEMRLNYFLGRMYSPDSPIPEEPVDNPFFKDPFAFCHSPLEGVWLSLKAIGDPICYNEAIGKIGGIEIRSPYEGQLWGLAHSGKIIAPKTNIALIFQGQPGEQFRYLGFRENAVAGGILEAIRRYELL